MATDWEQSGRCCNCTTQWCNHFSHNGYRSRTLGFLDYARHLRLPRAVCQCGGNVQLMFTGLLRPNQRLSNEVDAQIQHWGKMGHSLRDMKAELRHYYLGALGLHTLCARLDLTPGRNELETPPIVQIDAIWVQPAAPHWTSAPGCQGPPAGGKSHSKRCLLIAQGVWPD